MSSEDNNQHMKFNYPLGTGEPFHEERFEDPSARKPLKTPVRWRTIQVGLWMAAFVVLGVGYGIGVVHQGIRARESSDAKIAQVRAEFEGTLQRMAAQQGETPFRVISARCSQDLDGFYACGAPKPQGRD